MKYILNNKHLRYYTNRCDYWKSKLKVPYSLTYDWIEDRTKKGHIQYTIDNKLALVQLGTIWDNQPTNKALNIVAFHEICHLLLSPITYLAEVYYNNDYIGELEHSIIRVLEDIVNDRY